MLKKEREKEEDNLNCLQYTKLNWISLNVHLISSTVFINYNNRSSTYADLQTVEEAILDILNYLVTDIYNG